jgi:hypothetical protein
MEANMSVKIVVAGSIQPGAAFAISSLFGGAASVCEKGGGGGGKGASASLPYKDGGVGDKDGWRTVNG